MDNFVTFGFSFLLNGLVAFLIIRAIYYPVKRDKEYVLTFLTFNTLIFLIAHLLQGVNVTIGLGLSMFAIFRMLRYRTDPIPIECVARGYLAGSGWQEYQESGTICGIKLPAGLVESSKLPEPIFTPATKEEVGEHDINITFEEMVERIGNDLSERLREITLTIYERARRMAEAKGIIIADTKLEFGLLDGEIILIDELLTPDSSRFWPADEYQPGRPQHAFDKQFLRDYLLTLDWDKTPPPPPLPKEIIEKTGERYEEALRRLTG